MQTRRSPVGEFYRRMYHPMAGGQLQKRLMQRLVRVAREAWVQWRSR